MNTVPIVFAFDNAWIKPACVCISSLMMSAHTTTFYDIFIIHSQSEQFNQDALDCIPKIYQNCRIQYIEIGDTFENSFEIRGITTSTYYRLLIPVLIPQYDKVIYSDVDVIFRNDLWNIYNSTDMKNTYVAGVNTLSYLISDLKEYYENELGIDSHAIIYAGNIILNSKYLRENNIVQEFINKSKEKYRFQDMDILNITCSGKITYLPPSFCVTTYFSDFLVNHKDELQKIWTEEDLLEAEKTGTIHYNGQKPWKGYCINFDIWWEYYRKSPYFDPKYYFDFFNKKLNDYDNLTLWKRIKILGRYFIHRPQ